MKKNVGEYGLSTALTLHLSNDGLFRHALLLSRGAVGRDQTSLFPRRPSEVEMVERHFPSPWCAEEWASCFVVSDAAGQPLAHIYFADEPGRRKAAQLLARDDARQIAENIARLPGLLLRHAAETELSSNVEAERSEISTPSL